MKVYSSIAVQGVVEELLPQFEKAHAVQAALT